MAVSSHYIVHLELRIDSHSVRDAGHSPVVPLKTRMDLNRAALEVGRLSEALDLSSYHSILDP